MVNKPEIQGDFNSKRWLKSYPKDVDYNAPLPAKSVGQVLDESVAKFGERTFLNFMEKKFNFMGKKYTYKEFGKMVDRAAAGMQANGIKKGSKVGLFLPNSPYFVINYYAALKIGATVVNLNPLTPEQDLIELSKDADIDMMVTLDVKALYPVLKKVQDDANIKKIVVCDLSDTLATPKKYMYRLMNRFNALSGKSKRPKIKFDGKTMSFRKLLSYGKKPTPVDIDPINDVAVYQYTGGTTGLPKAAMLTHANLTVNTEQTRLWFADMDKDGEKFFAILPFFHVFSMTTQMNLSMATGSELTMLLLEKPDLDQIAKAMEKEKPTVFAGVPDLWKNLIEHAKKNDINLSSLKMCLSGGAALPVAVKKAAEDYTGCTLVEGYGLSETSPVVSANPINGENKPGSIGLMFPGTEIELRDLNDPTKTVPLGQKGEIWLRGPQVMKGYFNNAEATADTMDKNGWLRTGDVATMDEEGYVFIVDRIKDMILSHTGNNVYPSKIEKALRQHENIDEVLVLGIPDGGKGEKIKAYITLKKGAEEFDRPTIKEFLKDKLKPYEVPKELEFRAELPKTQIGKPDRKELKRQELEKLKANDNNGNEGVRKTIQPRP